MTSCLKSENLRVSLQAVTLGISIWHCELVRYESVMSNELSVMGESSYEPL